MELKRTAKQIRTNVMTGILLLLPVVTTGYVFFKLFVLVDSFLPSFFHALIPVIPERWIPGIGLVFLLLLSYFVGLAAKNYVGKVIIQTGNAVISNIPLLNKIYLGVQQIVDAVAGKNKKLFERAVLIEYPKKDSFCIAFVTAETTGEIPDRTDPDMLSVFVPTTPNPTSGFLLFIPRAQVIGLDMNVETAIKMVMSAGMVGADPIPEDEHAYAIPDPFKKWSWLRVFKRDPKNRQE